MYTTILLLLGYISALQVVVQQDQQLWLKSSPYISQGMMLASYIAPRLAIWFQLLAQAVRLFYSILIQLLLVLLLLLPNQLSYKLQHGGMSSVKSSRTIYISMTQLHLSWKLASQLAIYLSLLLLLQQPQLYYSCYPAFKLTNFRLWGLPRTKRPKTRGSNCPIAPRLARDECPDKRVSLGVGPEAASAVPRRERAVECPDVRRLFSILLATRLRCCCCCGGSTSSSSQTDRQTEEEEEEREIERKRERGLTATSRQVGQLAG